LEVLAPSDGSSARSGTLSDNTSEQAVRQLVNSRTGSAGALFARR
jgi:hypothetical protein